MAFRFVAIALSSAVAIEWGPNPIMDDQVDLADPCVLEFDGKLYAYPTSNQAQYEVYTRDISGSSPAWSNEGVVFESHEICPYSWVPGVGNNSLVWAPHVMHDAPSGKFYLYYTVCMTVGVAVADSPLGPFTKVRNLVDLAIDAFTMRDDDGQLYLYYAKMWEFGPIITGNYAESIFGQRLLSPTELAQEDPVHLIHPDQDWWEFNSSMTGPFAGFLVGINEGPWVLKHGDLYYLTYSGAAANSEFYRLGYATASSPLGPFTKGSRDTNPIIHPENPSTIGVYGPGHHAVWRDASTGRYWAIYHRQKTNGTGWGRDLFVDELIIDEATGAMTLTVTPGSRSNSNVDMLV